MNNIAWRILIICGIFDLGFAFFHLMFWKIFLWKEDLASLTFINRSIMQILNLCLTFVFLTMAYVAFFHQPEMISTNLGKALLIASSLFWFFRMIEQMVFFGIKNRVSFMLTPTIFAGSVFHLLPVFVKA